MMKYLSNLIMYEKVIIDDKSDLIKLIKKAKRLGVFENTLVYSFYNSLIINRTLTRKTLNMFTEDLEEVIKKASE